MPTEDRLDTDIVRALEAYFGRYLVLKPGLGLVLALWSIATYVFQAFDAFPYLAITSPTKRCGKTRAGELLALACAKGRSTVGISVAALYRIIEKDKPTLIIDEAESLRVRSDRSSALREILNAGYRKGQKVIRCGPQDSNFKPQEFETFCPKVLVLIGNLPDTLADRCIPIKMTRRTREGIIERFRFARVKREVAPLRQRIQCWAKRNRKAVADHFEASDVPFLADREAELWLPLFVVCDLVAPHRRAELESAATTLAELKASDEPTDFGVRLLGDIRQIFEKRGADRLPTSTLLSDLYSVEDSPWPGWSQGIGLDDRSLSRLLRPFDIRSRSIRVDGAVPKGYLRESFQEAWESYLPPSIRYTATEGINIGRNEDSASATEQACSATEKRENPNVYAGCSAVADTRRE